MHGDDCQYGADICVTWRGHSWLGERGLRLARTGPGQDPVLTLPARQAAPARVDPRRSAMTGPTLRERLRDAGMSTWELGDLLGIHPHLVSDSHGQPLTARLVQPLIEIARRLDLHPADLVPELEPLLSRRRQASGDDLDQDLRADALTVLAALATARAPLSADQLARALGWPLPRTAAAIAAAQDDPGLGGPLALRRIPPETWTVTPRLDILTQAQRRALRDVTGAADLDDDQAAVLLAALAIGQKWQGGNYPGLQTRPGWAAAEAALKQAGLIYSSTGPDEVHVSDDVLFSLRRCEPGRGRCGRGGQGGPRVRAAARRGPLSGPVGPASPRPAGLTNDPAGSLPGRLGAPATNAALREPGTRARGRTPASGLVAASAGWPSW